ncbi:MAG: Hsp20/alpha crystallin family protein [Candidatus Omnitrophica bacterium]|nr:Hsp20/alpha crystallin family protein [Candidatus Omnitrophota bacterium]
MVEILHKHHHNFSINPFYELERFRRLGRQIFDLSFPLGQQIEATAGEGFWVPAMDVIDGKDNIIVKIDLPGMERKDIDITIENNVLMIQGERSSSGESEGEEVLGERQYGTFHRAFKLPSVVDPQKIDARLENGVLILSIAKKDADKLKPIKVEVK